MKKLLTRLTLMVVVAFTAIGCASDANKKDNGGASIYTDAIPENALAVVYLDAEQIVEKSGMATELQMMINQFAAESGNQDAIELLNNKFGIDTEKPFYGFVQFFGEEELAIAVVAQVKDLDVIKKTFDYINENVADTKTKGNNTVAGSESLYIGYNNNTVIIATCQGVDGFETVFGYLEDSQSGKNQTISDFSAYDLAAHLSVEGFINILENANSNNAEMADALQILENFKDGKLSIGLSFEQGRISASIKAENFNQECTTQESTPCNNNFLNCIPRNALAVMNFNFDGPQIAKVVSELPAAVYETLAEQMGSDVDELNMLIDVILEYVKTINGDVTLALDDINFETEQLYAYGMCSVSNSDLYNLFVNEMGEMGEQTAENQYRFFLDDISNYAYVGQEGNMLYASISNTPQSRPSNAKSAEWYNDVANSYGYIVINIKELLGIPFVKKQIDDEMRYESIAMRKVVEKILKLPSYIYFNAPTETAQNIEVCTLSLVLRDKNTNALKQICTIAKEIVKQNR